MRKAGARFIFTGLVVLALLGGGGYFLLRGVAEYRVGVLFGDFIPLKSLLERQLDDIILYDLSRAAFQRREEGKLETALWSGRIDVTNREAVRGVVRRQVDCPRMSEMCREELRQLGVLRRELEKARNLSAMIESRLMKYRSRFYLEGNRDLLELLNALQGFIGHMEGALKTNLRYVGNLGLPVSREIGFERDRHFSSASGAFVTYRGKCRVLEAFLYSRREGRMDVLLERYMETASGEYRRKAAVNSLSMVGESRKVVYHVAGDLNGDGVEEVAVVTSRPSENGLYLWSFSVYGWKDYSYSRAFEEELGPFRENLDVRPHEEGLPREFWRGLHLRFVSFVPEIVLIFQESSGEWTHFGWDGKKYVRLQRYDVD